MKAMNQEEVSALAQKRSEKSKKQSQLQRECDYCGKKHEAKKEACPAVGKICAKCGLKNHFAVKCKHKTPKWKAHQKKYKQKEVVKVIDDDSSLDSESDDFVLTVEEVNGIETYPKKLFAKMTLGECQINFQLDCGSTVNIISETDYKTICHDDKLKHLEKNNVTLVMYNNSETRALGKRKLHITNPKNKKVYILEFVIVQGKARPLLGAQAVQKMKLITVNKQHIMAIETTQNLVQEYEDIFSGEGLLEGELHLELTEQAKPVKLPVRKIPLAVKPRLRAEIQRLVKLGILTKEKEPTDWISSMVVVMKNNKKIRLCIDPQPLNKVLKRNHYPIPTIEDVLPELSRARIFTVVDAKNGFWHVKLEEESSKLTTFGTPWGRYRWRRMPFGIAPAPEEFQRRIDEALEGIQGVKAIHDDILVWGSGEDDAKATEDHDRKLRKLFERCRKKNVKLNKDKMKLRQKEVTFMGHVISADGLKVDSAKVEAIKDMPIPTDKQAVQRLLGMVNYVQKFAPRLSEVTEPLRQLIKKDVEFYWDKIHDKCLHEIREILTSAPVLRYFDHEKDTILQCDASETGLGACLLQEGHPVAYASRALTVTEVNYAQIEKELLAIVFGMERFENYVYGRRVVIESDHKPLEIICKKTLVSAPKRLQRMLLKLQKFDFMVVYKQGTQMYMADTLSRAYLPCTKKVWDSDRVFEVDTRSFTEKAMESVSMVEYLPVSMERITEIQR